MEVEFGRWRIRPYGTTCWQSERVLGVEYDHDTQLQEAFDAQGDDLVRHAKKLAERRM